MPYLKEVKTDRLTLPSDESYWVELKQRASYGDKAAAQNALMKVTQTDAAKLNGRRLEQAVVDKQTGRAVVTEFETQAYFTTLAAAMIVDWNLDDEAGLKLKITPQNIAKLDAEDGDFIQAEVQKRIGGRPQDQQGPS